MYRTPDKPHPRLRGFANNAAAISKKEGLPMANARAILASASRGASPAAKRANPNLRRVK